MSIYYSIYTQAIIKVVCLHSIAGSIQQVQGLK